MVKLGISRERLSAVFDIVFVESGGVLAERSAIKAVFDDLPGELKGDGLTICQ